MFSIMWGTGILGILFCISHKYFQKEKIQNFNQQKIQAVRRNRDSILDINIILSKYLDEIFPIVYQTQSYFTRMINEIIKHHRYIDLLMTPSSSSQGSSGMQKKILTCAHLLTVQTLLMFLLAVCYELQVSDLTSHLFSFS